MSASNQTEYSRKLHSGLFDAVLDAGTTDREDECIVEIGQITEALTTVLGLFASISKRTANYQGIEAYAESVRDNLVIAIGEARKSGAMWDLAVSVVEK